MHLFASRKFEAPACDQALRRDRRNHESRLWTWMTMKDSENHYNTTTISININQYHYHVPISAWNHELVMRGYKGNSSTSSWDGSGAGQVPSKVALFGQISLAKPILLAILLYIYIYIFFCWICIPIFLDLYPQLDPNSYVSLYVCISTDTCMHTGT